MHRAMQRRRESAFARLRTRLPRRGFLALAALFAATAAVAPDTAFAAYPERPIQVVISFPPAGATDVLARAIGAALGKELGTSVVVENKPGAGGTVGLATAVKAPADGYNLHFSAITNQAIAAAVYRKQPGTLLDDFVPVGGVGTVPHVLVVPAGLPVKDIPGLAAYLKAAPGKYNFASQGVGTLSHLESELFLIKTGAKATHIPYKGSSQALPEVVNGSSIMMFDSFTGSLPLVQAGKLRFLAAASSRRISLLPDVPTVSESGVQGFEANNYFGFFAPKGTPRSAVDTLSAALQKALADPALIRQLAAQGAELHYTPPAELTELVRKEHEIWGGVVKSADIPVQ